MSMSDADLIINMSLLEMNVYGLREAVDKRQLKAIKGWLNVIRKTCGDIDHIITERECELEQYYDVSG